MTEQPNKEKFKQAIDHTLSSLTGDPFLYQRVAANSEKGAKPVRYHFPKGVLIALIAILCMCTVAVATSVYGGTVNWLGQVVPDERQTEPMPIITPPVVESYTELDEDDLDQLSKDGTMLVVSQIMEDGEILPHTSTRMKRVATSMEDFHALLNGAENMLLPNFIPEGYEFVEGEVYYDCRADGEWQLTDRKELEGGLLAEQYSLDKEDEIIRGYYLFFRNSPEDYHYLSIYAGLREKQDVNEQIFGFLAGQTAQKVIVPGMENALAITSEHSCNLSMRRALAQPVGYLLFQEADWQAVCTYAELDLSVSAPLLDTDTLIRMFAAE